MSLYTQSQDFYRRALHIGHAIRQWLPFTFGGAVFCGFSGLATWFFGVQRSDFVLIVIGSMGLLMSLIGMLTVLLSGFVLYRRYRQLDFCTLQLRCHAEHSIVTPIEIRWWLPLVQVSVSWSSPRMESVIEGRYERLTPTRRGVWNSIHRVIRVGDAFGICAIEFDSVQPCTLKVLPQVSSAYLPNLLQGLQQGGEQAHPLGSASGDRIDIRNYAHGDPVRFILWKVYARTGQLVVRTPEKAFEPVQRVLAYLVVHPADSAAAALSMAMVDSDRLGDNWAFGVDGHSEACQDSATAMEAIVASGRSTVRDGEGMIDFVQQESDAGSLLVFAPPEIGEWIERVETLSHTLSVQVCLVGLAPQKRSTMETLLYSPTDLPSSTMDVETVLGIARRLSTRQIPMTIVHIDSGRIFDGQAFAQQFGAHTVQGVA